jgi:crotonobetainyl-CoA:carnitine CoA-transferase CaiB-like acyl-CoA transferase
MLDAMVAFLWPEGLAELTFPDHQSRHGERGSLAPDLIYETADGFITAGAVSDAEWQGLCRALEQPEWLEDERFATPGGRVANAEERLTLTAEVMATRTTEAWLERLDAEQVPCAPVLRRWDVPDHPQVQANGLVREIEHPRAGTVREARPAARFSAASDTAGRPAPGLGQHTDELLHEVGYSADDIRDLRASGAVA